MADLIRFQYAVKATLPTAWIFAGLVPEGDVVTIPPQPSGAIVWVRSRRERPGYRPSRWGTPFQITVNATNPALYSMTVRIDEYGVPSVSWESNPATGGMRIEWSIQPQGESPVYTDSVDVEDYNDLFYEFSTSVVNNGERINVRLTPFVTYSGGVASGAHGLARTASKSQHHPLSKAVTAAAVSSTAAIFAPTVTL